MPRKIKPILFTPFEIDLLAELVNECIPDFEDAIESRPEGVQTEKAKKACRRVHKLFYKLLHHGAD